MTQRDDILRELNELQSQIGVTDHPGYQVPEGYFDGLANAIIQRIKALEAQSPREELDILSPMLSGITKNTPFTVPAGYFNDLSEKIQLRDGLEPGSDTAEASGLLDGLKNKTTYTVPQGYFENLPALIVEKATAGEAKVVSITSRKWFRYAAAAGVIAFVTMLGFSLLQKKAVDPQNRSYAWVEKNLKKVSTDDIAAFVDLASPEKTDLAKVDTRDDISSLLKDVSDKEIQDFLNETLMGDNGSDKELILN